MGATNDNLSIAADCSSVPLLAAIKNLYKKIKSPWKRTWKGRQCFSFGGRKCGLSREVLEGFAGMVLKKLDAGVSECDAGTWVKDAVKRYGD